MASPSDDGQVLVHCRVIEPLLLEQVHQFYGLCARVAALIPARRVCARDALVHPPVDPKKAIEVGFEWEFIGAKGE